MRNVVLENVNEIDGFQPPSCPEDSLGDDGGRWLGGGLYRCPRA